MKVTMRFFLLAMVWLTQAVCAQEVSPSNVAAALKTYILATNGFVEQSAVPSGILYDLTLPLSPVAVLNGSDTCHAAEMNDWLQVCYELHHAAVNPIAMPEPQTFRNLASKNSAEHIHSIAILNFTYQRVRDGWRADSVLRMQDGTITEVDGGGLETRQVFAAAALNSRTYRGERVQFHVDMHSLYFTNSAAPLAKLKINFDDERGFRDVSLSDNIDVNYISVGRKIVEVRATQTDGLVRSARFIFDVITLTTPNPTQTWNLQAALPYNGRASSGEAYIYLAANHTQLTKPIIISEGFDLNNSVYWDGLYAMLNQQNLLEDLRSLGYDEVVLNYDSATTYIQRNAYLVETLLDSVYARVGGQQQFVLIGPSMGGITTRYALIHMEQNNHPHHIRKLIEFDAPNRGGNVPLCLQYWVDFFASQSTDAAMERDILNSPAARQLLVTHYTIPASTTAGPDPMRATLLNDFAAYGNYPTLPRLVAIVNGSGYQHGLDFNPGAQLIRYQYSNILMTITGNCWALNNAASQQIFNGVLYAFLVINQRESVTVQPTWPWDNAPGGTRNSMAQLDSVPAPYGDVIALHPSHCFIPTISSLDVNTSDPFYNVAGDANLLAHVPFNKVYFPVNNQEHVAITPESYWWFMNEIVDSLPAPSVVVRMNNGQIQLHWPLQTATRSFRVYSTTDLNTWPLSYSTTTDTSWTDNDISAGRKFYRVAASMALPTAALRSDAEPKPASDDQY